MIRNETYFPEASDTPRGYLGGHAGTLPILRLAGTGGEYATGLALQWSPDDHDQAVRYLDTLSDAAASLAAKIRLAQAAAQVDLIGGVGL